MKSILSKLPLQLVILILLTVTNTAIAFSQTSQISVNGKVKNAQGTLIQNVTVRLDNQNTKTDENGTFSFMVKNTGNYTVVISAVG